MRSLLSAARRAPALSLFLLAALWPGRGAAQPTVLPEIQVISTSPFPGGGIDRDKVPALVQTLTAEDFSRSYSSNVTDTLFQHIPGVSTSDQQGNSFQTDIRYRGFVASPVPGQPQGLAVYMNGIRLNEAFGDTANFDFIPSNAIDRADLQSNNPVFGLNALGGAISFQMKNGFTFQGSEADFQFGSYGRVSGGVQYGSPARRRGRLCGGAGTERGGLAPAFAGQLARLYADIGWRRDGNEVHLVLSGASNFFGVVGGERRSSCCSATGPRPTPFRRRRRTRPCSRRVNGKFMVAENWTLQSNVYARKFRQAHLDGNGADVERCSAASSFPNRLCLEDDGFPRPTPVTAGVPQPVRRARPEQQSDPVPARRRQHLRAGALRHDRSHQHRHDDDRRLAAGGKRRGALRPRQPLHARRQHRPQLDQLFLEQHARLHQSGPLGHHQSRRFPETGRSSTRSAIWDLSRSASMRRTPTTASTRPTRSTSHRSFR